MMLDGRTERQQSRAAIESNAEQARSIPEPHDDGNAEPPAEEVRQVTISFPMAEPLHYAVKMRAVQERTIRCAQ